MVGAWEPLLPSRSWRTQLTALPTVYCLLHLFDLLQQQLALILGVNSPLQRLLVVGGELA